MLVPCRVSPLFFPLVLSLSLSLSLSRSPRSWFTSIHPVDLSPDDPATGCNFSQRRYRCHAGGGTSPMAKSVPRRSWFLLRSSGVPRYDADTRWLMAMEVARSGRWRILVRRARVFSVLWDEGERYARGCSPSRWLLGASFSWFL